jgi:putative hydrolase of the HAD superfamily
MPERPTLEAVLLDAGGTLVRLDFEWMTDALRALGHDMEVGRLRRAEIAGRRRFDGSRVPVPVPGAPSSPLGSSWDSMAYFGGMLEAAGISGDAIPAVLERFAARHARKGLWECPMEGAREALDALLDLGLRCAVVSNSDGRAEEHLAKCGVRHGLEFVVDSQRVGVEKPDPRIFSIALERLGVDASRALFVGDIRSVDEAGARAAGVHFVLLDPYGDYAAPEVPAVSMIGDVPEWIERRFEILES